MSLQSKINTLSTYTRATLSFLKALFAPMDKADSVCSRGHVLLPNWQNCPHCRLINRQEELKKDQYNEAQKAAKLGLFCISGANKGKSYFISRERSTIGCDAGCNIVLTPESLNTHAHYQILINGSVKISSSDTHYFKLNGQAQQMATLLDFDELEILDNRFIVLDLRAETGVSYDH